MATYTYEVIGYITVTADNYTEAGELFAKKLEEVTGINDLDCVSTTITEAPPWDN